MHQRHAGLKTVWSEISAIFFITHKQTVGKSKKVIVGTSSTFNEQLSNHFYSTGTRICVIVSNCTLLCNVPSLKPEGVIW